MCGATQKLMPLLLRGPQVQRKLEKSMRLRRIPSSLRLSCCLREPEGLSYSPGNYSGSGAPGYGQGPSRVTASQTLRVKGAASSAPHHL